jgi:serine/threonine protein kinase
MNQRLGTGRLIGGRYRLEALLARGGMAEVWEATDQSLGRAVAVKLLHPHLAEDEGFRRRLRAEAVAVARLVHPNIVAVHDVCSEDAGDAIVMELVRGRTLRSYLDERGRLEPVEVVHIGSEVAAGLSCAHRHGLVHRDVKPANIMLSDDGRVLVADFGIAKILDSADVTATSTLLGTAKYLAPEQVEGRAVDARTDVYALGAVLYECLCGRPPFERDSPSATALARLTAAVEPASTRAPGVSATLDPVLGRALARAPADRYPSASDLRSALLTPPPAAAEPEVRRTDPLSGERLVESGHVSVSAPLPSPERPARRRSAATVMALLLVVSAVVVIVLLVATTNLGRNVLDGSISSSPSVFGPGGRVPSTTADIEE